MRAWWAYWLTLAIGAALWIGATVVGGREEDEDRAWSADLGSRPAGPDLPRRANLVCIPRATHEVVCRMEAKAIDG